MIEVAAGTPIARQGQCVIQILSDCIDRDGGLARGVIESVNQGTPPQYGTGKT
jgi:hypothetical protein